MNIILIAIYLICGIYLILNFKRDIHMLQQNSYRISRYKRWLENGNFLTGWRLIDMALIFLLMSTLLTPMLCLILTAIVLIGKCIVIFKTKHKKPLVFTKRVWRIYSVSAVLGLIPFIIALVFFGQPGQELSFYSGPGVAVSILLLTSILSWAFVMAAVWILKPVETHINKGYWNEARSILKGMPDLKIVGITGSYGKTSTKHYLHTILSERYETLMTPGSYNTPMGVIRTVREMMKPYTEVFICEMGAKQKGDIKEICDLVDPHCGIITAVGPMHLETFGNIETVCSTKFELADAIPADGFVVINNDFAPAAARKVENTEAIRYGVSNPAGCEFVAKHIKYTPDGTTFTIEGKDGERHEYTTRLIGECNISNLMAAIIVAHRLGLDEETIRRGVRRIEQVEHRLNVKRTPGGVTIIDDAFNSNPDGSKMALEVLGQFDTGRRICVTPGMIELGDRREELNRQLGRHIGENADIAIIVNAYNRDALVEGILDAGFDKPNLYVVDNFNAAQQKLHTILRAGDIVLYENDLPDSFK